MKAKLTLHDRVVLINLLPAEGNYEELILTDGLKKKLEVSEEEREAHIKTEGNNLTFGDNPEKQYTFNESQKEHVRKVLKAKSEEKKLHISALPLYKKFAR